MKRFTAPPEIHAIQFRNKNILREGQGISFWYSPKSSEIAVVPMAMQSGGPVFAATCADHREVVIYAILTYRMVRPLQLTKALDFTIDPEAWAYRSSDPENLVEQIMDAVQATTRNHVGLLPMDKAVSDADAIAKRVLDDVRGTDEFAALGVQIEDLEFNWVKSRAALSAAGDPGPPIRDNVRSDLHLRNARVDLDGRIIAEGFVEYPPDEDGLFTQASHKYLALSIDREVVGPKPGKVVPVRVRRDKRSGFFVSEAIGPTIHPPSWICVLLYCELRFGPKNSVPARPTSEPGYLRTENVSGQTHRQPLSDWKLDTDFNDGEAEITLSAALAQPDDPDRKDSDGKTARQYWTLGPKNAPRLRVTFKVDLATRAVYLGAYDRLLEAPTSRQSFRGGAPIFRWLYRPTNERGDDAGVSLETAQLGHVGAIYGKGSPKPWVSVHSTRYIIAESGVPNGKFLPSISFSNFERLERDDNGFIIEAQQWFPRVSLDGVNLETIADLLKERRHAQLTHNDGISGDLGDPRAERDEYEIGKRVDRKIYRAALSFKVSSAGLTIAYRVFCPTWRQNLPNAGWFEGSCVLSWNVLIIHYPELAKRWRSLWCQVKA